ncbi:uncharacterized protein N7483_002447 [Penicillium malachiteum]|uniref:uncharacterized protein n=1 Tax=Penicillium malachiteum TaxID=1324776 RepID=UPI002546CEF1|nr:uncharacterized protein N7483_002447 [Penicillium malachiteum]KAJ5737322.1 hypothetical protein N7483_002447 [Penicillium malachiteum]
MQEKLTKNSEKQCNGRETEKVRDCTYAASSGVCSRPMPRTYLTIVGSFGPSSLMSPIELDLLGIGSIVEKRAEIARPHRVS